MELDDDNWVLSYKKRNYRICKKCDRQQFRDWWKRWKRNQDQQKKKYSEQKKRHHEKYKDKYSEQAKQYYQENKDKISEYWQSPKGRESRRKTSNKRNREYGWNPLNDDFPGSHGHHLHLENKDDVVYIPDWLHDSIRHRPNNSESMYRINLWTIFWMLYGDPP